MVAGQPGARMPGDVSLWHPDPARHVMGGRESTGLICVRDLLPCLNSVRGFKCAVQALREPGGAEGAEKEAAHSHQDSSLHHRGQN